MLEQAYDVTVELTLPNSLANADRGNFMVALFAMESRPDNPPLSLRAQPDPYEHVTEDKVVFSSRRPVLIPYTDPIVYYASRVLFLLYHVLWPASERLTLSIPMGELVEFRDALPMSILLDVQAGQSLQVYSATITLVARLTGVRWAMYNHRILSFVLCTTMFWLCEMLFTGLAFLVVGYCFRSPNGPKDEDLQDGADKDRSVKREPGTQASPPAGQSSAGPVRAREALSKDEDEDEGEIYDDRKMKEESTEQETLVDQSRHGGDTDDEEDGEEHYAGRGTAFDGKGDRLRRRSSRGDKFV